MIGFMERFYCGDNTTAPVWAVGIINNLQEDALFPSTTVYVAMNYRRLAVIGRRSAVQANKNKCARMKNIEVFGNCIWILEQLAESASV